jgi:hypothetical protein
MSSESILPTHSSKLKGEDEQHTNIMGDSKNLINKSNKSHRHHSDFLTMLVSTRLLFVGI